MDILLSWQPFQIWIIIISLHTLTWGLLCVKNNIITNSPQIFLHHHSLIPLKKTPLYILNHHRKIISHKSPISSRSVFWLRLISEYAPTVCHLACWYTKHLLRLIIITNKYDLYGDSCDALLTTSLKNRLLSSRFVAFWVHFGAPKGIFHTALISFRGLVSHFCMTWINDSTRAVLSSTQLKIAQNSWKWVDFRALAAKIRLFRFLKIVLICAENSK